MKDPIASFELHLAPQDFYLAVMPIAQAAVVAVLGPRHHTDGKARAVVVPDDKKLVLPIVESVTALAASHELLSTVPSDPESAFTGTTAKVSSVHLRVIVRDQMWASFYPLDSLPANVRQLVDEARELAEKIVREHPEISLKHEHALQLLAQASLPVAAWNQLEGLIGLKILWHTAAGGPLRWLWTALAVMGLGALAGLWNLVPQGFFLMICGAVLIALVLAVRSWSGHRP